MKELTNILQISSVGRPIKPDLKYGGTARVILYLDKEFSKRGYNSFVAATGDSKVYGNLIETLPESLSLFTMNGEKNGYTQPRKKHDELSEEHYSLIIEYILKNDKIDIIHEHPGSGILISKKFNSLKSKINCPLLITLHGAFSENYRERYSAWNLSAKEKGNIYFNAISKNQGRFFEENGFNIEEVIYHGIPLENFEFQKNKQDYLFSLGRICPKKGQHIAVNVAKKTGNPLIIAGEINSVFHDYWKETIEPNLTFSITNIPEEEQENYKNDLVEKLNSCKEIIGNNEIMFIGNLTDKQKMPFYKNAKSFIMPIQWQEPFGLTMIESMACGTPVIVNNFGSVSEVMRNGHTGIIIKNFSNEKENVELIINALKNIPYIHPNNCRKEAENRFSIKREANKYLDLYKKLINKRWKK
jgi:glycosyltransferase involved in cell wall biosynthesis